MQNIDSLGTTVQVKNLFKQIPVKRQMIINTRKVNQTIKLLEILIQSFSICKPNVRIQFRVNNNIIFTKPSLNNIRDAVTHVLSRKTTSKMEWIEPKDIEVCFLNLKVKDIYFLYFIISNLYRTYILIYFQFGLQLMLPSKQVQDLSEIFHSGLQYIFINNRPIKHKDIEKVYIIY